MKIPSRTLFLSLCLFGPVAHADQQSPTWGGTAKPAPVAPRAKGAEPQPLSATMTSTLSGPVTYTAYGMFEADGNPRRLHPSHNQVLGRNINSVEHVGNGTYFIRLYSNPTFPVCVATPVPEEPAGGLSVSLSQCFTRTSPGTVTVNCFKPAASDPKGWTAVDRAFSLICHAP